MLKTEGWESKAEVGRQGREITVMKDYSTRESVSNDQSCLCISLAKTEWHACLRTAGLIKCTVQQTCIICASQNDCGNRDASHCRSLFGHHFFTQQFFDVLVHQPNFLHSYNIHTANYHCTPLCPFYRDPRHGSWRGISWQMQTFHVTELLCSGTIKLTAVSHTFLSYDFKLYCSFYCHFPNTVCPNNLNFKHAHSSYCKNLICTRTVHTDIHDTVYKHTYAQCK
jgi:hypothetical protein